MYSTELLGAVIYCSLLGSIHFQVRQEAETCLAEMGDYVIPFIELSTKSKDPEVRRRAENLLKRRLPDKIEQLLQKYKAWGGTPWLDASLELDEKVIDFYYNIGCFDCCYRFDGNGQLCCDFVKKKTLIEPEPWKEFREATRAYVINQIYNGVSLEQMDSFLKGLRENSEKFASYDEKNRTWFWKSLRRN